MTDADIFDLPRWKKPARRNIKTWLETLKKSWGYRRTKHTCRNKWRWVDVCCQTNHVLSFLAKSQKTVVFSKLQLLEKKNQELKENEEKLKSANSELCTKMREMIQELDQEKQEAAER